MSCFETKLRLELRDKADELIRRHSRKATEECCGRSYAAIFKAASGVTACYAIQNLSKHPMMALGFPSIGYASAPIS